MHLLTRKSMQKGKDALPCLCRCVKYRTCYPMFAVNQIEQKVLKSFNEDSQLRTKRAFRNIMFIFSIHACMYGMESPHKAASYKLHQEFRVIPWLFNLKLDAMFYILVQLLIYMCPDMKSNFSPNFFNNVNGL